MRTKCFCLLVAVLAFSGSQPVLHDIKPTATVAVSAAVAGANISGAAAVRGTVRLEGQAPKGKPINMDKEPVCVKAHPTPALTEEVVTGPDNALQNVIVYVFEGLPGSSFDRLQNPPSSIKRPVFIIRTSSHVRLTRSSE